MKAHRLDPISLVAGALFTLLGVVGASGSLASIEDLRIVGPMALLVAGMLLVSSALTAGRTDHPADEPPTISLGARPASVSDDLAAEPHPADDLTSATHPADDRGDGPLG